MARRLTNRQQEMVKEHIKTTQILKRVQDHLLGNLKLSNTQLRAAELLLSKSVPSLKAIEHTGHEGGPIEIQQRAIEFVDPGNSLQTRTRDPLAESDD
jgi:hypothetical protein